jgi:hypothetical protein
MPRVPVPPGIVSARGRDIGAGPYDDFIQIDAPVNKGNSGGPTFDVDGNVIGVNTAIFAPVGRLGLAGTLPVRATDEDPDIIDVTPMPLAPEPQVSAGSPVPRLDGGTSNGVSAR